MLVNEKKLEIFLERWIFNECFVIFDKLKMNINFVDDE